MNGTRPQSIEPLDHTLDPSHRAVVPTRPEADGGDTAALAPSRAEELRLQVLHDLGILDTAPEASFDRIAKLAARVFDVPIALVSFVDADRQWFKARVGLDACESPREHAFCAHAIRGLGTDPFIVPDATLDDRFATNPLVTGAPFIRFYAGQPLVVAGQQIGTLCISDRQPRSISPDERRTLRDLGWMVENLLERSNLQTVLRDLDQSRRRKIQILHTMHDGLVVQDPTGAIVDWNPAAERTLGLDGDQLAGRRSVDPRWNAVHADGTPWLGEDHPAMEVLRTGTPVHDATMGVNRPGQGLAWLRVSSSPIIDEDGAITGAITSFTDITEITNTAGRLRDMEQLQRATLDVLEQGVIVGQRDGSVSLMNAAAQRILQLDVEQLTSKMQGGTWISYHQDGTILPVPDRPLRRTLWRGERLDGEVIGWERGDGSPVLVRVSTSPIPDNPDRVMMAFSDVTDSHRDRQLLDLTFARAPHGMAVLDDRGNFVSVNDALCTFLERSREELVELHYRDVSADLDHEDGAHGLAALIAGEADHHEMDTRFVLPDDTAVDAHLAVAVLRSQSLRRRYFIAHVADIRERIETEQAKDQALAAERAAVRQLTELDRIKTDFVSTVSHELRTPLTSILGYLELIEDATAEDGETETSAMLDVVGRNAHRLLHLIEDLLTLSNVELHPHHRRSDGDVDINKLVTAAASTLRPLADERQLDLEFRLSPTGPIKGDPAQLERAILNVISNAIKFSRPGGLVELRVQQHARTVTIEVVDNGIGIPADELPHLFTRFFRSTNAQEQAIPGTGLGLAISRQIVERHDGTIHAASEPGCTTMTITLPIA